MTCECFDCLCCHGDRPHPPRTHEGAMTCVSFQVAMVCLSQGRLEEKQRCEPHTHTHKPHFFINLVATYKTVMQLCIQVVYTCTDVVCTCT